MPAHERWQASRGKFAAGRVQSNGDGPVRQCSSGGTTTRGGRTTGASGPRSREISAAGGRHTKQGPPAHAPPRAALIVSQVPLFTFLEVDFTLAAARIGIGCIEGIKGEVGPQQIPRRKEQPGDEDNPDARGQRTVGLHAAQQDVRVVSAHRCDLSSM